MRSLLPLLALTLALTTTAQPTWRFHLAFEDGTGARDTIWMIFDTTATYGFGNIDEQFGEEAMHMDLDAFNVWVINPEYDSTKSVAVPYDSFFPYLTVEIQAFNYTYPVILRWDTALFHAPGLPSPGYFPGAHMQCNYFFGVPETHVFDMTSNDTTIAPIDLFPLLVNIGFMSTEGTDELHSMASLEPFPNPGCDGFTIRDAQPIQEVQLRSLDGRLWKVQRGRDEQMDLNLPDLPAGLYILRVLRADGTWRQATWVKAD